MNTNILGLCYYIHEVLPIFKKQGTPCRFMFTASIAGLIKGLRYNTAYLASKHAAVCLAEAVRDLADNDPDYSHMGVSVFCPEYVHTDIHISKAPSSDGALAVLTSSITCNSNDRKIPLAKDENLC